MALCGPLILRSRYYATASQPYVGLFGGSSKIAALLWARGLLGFGGIAFAFLSLEFIPIADSITLLMMSPFYAAFISYIFLGEPWFCVEYVGAALSIVGVVLVSRPPLVFDHLAVDTGRGDLTAEERRDVHYGLICAVLAGVCAGCAYCVIRVLGTTAKMPWPNIAFVQGLVQALLAVPSMYVVGQRFSLDIGVTMWGAIVGVAVIGSCSQFSMTIGMQHEKSARATLMRMSDILGGIMWQVIFTHDSLSVFTLSGALLIAMGVLIVVIFKKSSGTTTSHDAEVSAISQLMRKVEMQVVAESTRNQRYSQLQRDEDDIDEEDREIEQGEAIDDSIYDNVHGGKTAGDEEDDLDEMCMTEDELRLLKQLEGGLGDDA